jgi:hypothetical protein
MSASVSKTGDMVVKPHGDRVRASRAPAPEGLSLGAARRIAELVERLPEWWTVREGRGSRGRVIVASLGDRMLYARASSDRDVDQLVTLASRPRPRSSVGRPR